MVSNILRFVLLISLLGWQLNSFADAVASITRDTVALDETFLVVFNVEGDDIGDPDFSGLEKDFKIIGRSSSATTQIINFKRSDKKQWKLHLQAKKPGRLKIPPIDFGAYQSQALYVLVNKEAPAKTNIKDMPIFIESEASQGPAYVQQEIVYKLKLYNAIPGAEPRHIDKMDVENAVVKTAEPVSYQKRINGINYTVYEFRYYIYPQKAGELTIPSLKISTAIPTSNSVSSFFRQRHYNEELLRSRKVQLDIKPVDTSLGINPWLPANNLEIKDNLKPDQLNGLTVGDAISRSITIRAEGSLAEFLPDIDVTATNGLKIYPEKPQFENQPQTAHMLAEKTVKQEILLSSAGKFTLPSISIKWLDTDNGKVQTATLPARDLFIQGPKNKPGQTEKNNNVDAGGVTSAEQYSSNLVSQSLTKTGSRKIFVTLLVISGLINLVFIFLIAWLIYTRKQFLSVLRQHDTDNDNSSGKQQIDLLKTLQQACQNGQALQARVALGSVARNIFLCHSADQINHSDIIKEINKLDKAIENQEAWNGDNLYSLVKQAAADIERNEKNTTALEPLYPGQ